MRKPSSSYNSMDWIAQCGSIVVRETGHQRHDQGHGEVFSYFLSPDTDCRLLCCPWDALGVFEALSSRHISSLISGLRYAL